MKIAILYICTGKYASFFEGFYQSSEKFLLTGHEKHYFVWTDNSMIVDGLPNVTHIYKKCEGFPKDSLFRFEFFMQVEDQLKEYDYIYFFNSNAQILCPVGDEILPDETGLSMGVWPFGRKKAAHSYMYERNRCSLAYVAPYGKDYIYYMGGLNGGTSVAYLQMINTLCENIRKDYNNGIIAIFHDESHINAYMRNHPGKKLGREFCMPEEWVKGDWSPKIIFRNKVKEDNYFSKGRKRDFISRLKKSCNKVWRIVRWYIKA